jgi:hypothetical protein
MSIPKEVFKELIELGVGQSIPDPNRVFLITSLSKEQMDLIGTNSSEVFISARSLKHIIDQRRSEEIVYFLSEIITSPTKVVDNSKKRSNSFLFVKKNGKIRGAVVEITKTPDGNRVVSAFPISIRYYRKLIDISGRTAVPPFATPVYKDKEGSS